MVAERNPQVKKAVVTLRKLSADEQARDMYERRQKALRDMNSRERFVREEGKAEERKVWEVVVADKDAEITNKEAEIANKDAEIANKDAEIARLRKKYEQN